jgi:hypothetical protein
MWAKYGSAPSAEEIDENRREMFRNFAKDFNDRRRCGHSRRAVVFVRRFPAFSGPPFEVS